MRHARRARGAALGLWLVLAGCGGGAAPEWIDLARSEAVGARPVGTVGPDVRVEREGSDLWLVGALERAAWRAEAQPGRFSAPLPVFAVGAPKAGGAPYRLRAGERDLAYEGDPEAFGREPGRFTSELTRAVLQLAPGEEPPARAELWSVLDFEESGAAGRRVGGRRMSGAGLWVPSGLPCSIALTIPPNARLRFATAVEPLLAERGARTAPHTFRVRLDGATVFEHVLAVGELGEALEWHALDLPRGGVQKARLDFEVEGPLALTSFLAPRIGPREFGTYAARPPELGAPRRDMVVFLADTFRADGLAAYGSELGLTPEIDRFASESRTFTHAWSTSTHTLPSHSSMFSGVYPQQNGQVDYYSRLPGAVETLAERLSAHGYRCGLVSDGVIVSRSHGLDQGFESFDERKELDTLARVRTFLAADDGRPIFLFVQSYHVHAPYDVEPATRARWQDVLRLERGFEELLATPLIRAIATHGPEREGPPVDPAGRETVRELFDLYRAKVTELDGLFGAFRAELEARGLFGRATLLFTSDHGEAFFEHGRPFHAGRVYEEELRVPLILHAPGLAPGREDRPVSLIDFAPTLADQAGLARPAHWRGLSLLTPEEGRVIYAFQSREKEQPTLAVIEGTRKLIGYEDLAAVRAGRLHAAFDLGADPAEQANLLQHEAWPAELLRRHKEALVEMLTPRVTSERLDPNADKRIEMQHLGYGGASGDEDEEK